MDPRCESYDIDVLKDQANADLFGPDEKRKKVLYLHGHINKESSIIITKEAVEGTTGKLFYRKRKKYE